jgi:hypothetical protein
MDQAEPTTPLQFFMHGPVSIVPGNIRDVTFVTANIRPVDRTELECQMPVFDGSIASRMAIASSHPRSWTAWLGGEPRVAFGFSIVNCCTLQAWQWGDRYTTRCLPAIRSMRPFILADLRQQGWRRIEIRVLAAHKHAIRWIELLGGRFRAKLYEHGKNGELFLLYDMTLTDVSDRATQDHADH